MSKKDGKDWKEKIADKKWSKHKNDLIYEATGRPIKALPKSEEATGRRINETIDCYEKKKEFIQDPVFLESLEKCKELKKRTPKQRLKISEDLIKKEGKCQYMNHEYIRCGSDVVKGWSYCQLHINKCLTKVRQRKTAFVWDRYFRYDHIAKNYYYEEPKSIEDDRIRRFIEGEGKKPPKKPSN